MALEIRSFGRANGAETKLYTLTEDDFSFSVTDAGASIAALRLGGHDMVLGYNDGAGYLASPSYQAAFVGRYANRIANSEFVLNGRKIKVTPNTEGGHQLHGGINGFNRRIWKTEAADDRRIVLSLHSPDGDEGYPAALDVRAEFALNGGALRLTVTAESDGDTVFSPCQHPYFNLNADMQSEILDSSLTVYANYFSPLAKGLISDGTLLPVENTPYDFRSEKSLRDSVLSDFPQIRNGGGIDINYALDKGCRFGPAVRFEGDCNIALTVLTDRPAVQIYSSNSLDENNGKNGPLFRFQGLAIEPQMFPNSVNLEGYPTTELKKGERYHSVTEYRLERKVADK